MLIAYFSWAENAVLEEGVDAIWYPCMSYNNDEGIGDNHYNCPVVAYYPELLAANVPLLKQTKFLNPYVGLWRHKDFEKRIAQLMEEHFSIPRRETAAAAKAAYAAYDAYVHDVRETGMKYIRHARDHGNDMVFLDTAGRLHVDEALMDELKRMKAAVRPNEILLVVDAMTGQDAVNAASAFDEALGIDGVVLTKLDGDARGGAALSIRASTGKPIKFVGTGEKLDMIEPFHPDRMASRILGMGDMLSFIEKAQQTYDEKQAAKLEEKLRKNRLTLQDYYEQLQQLRNMGDLSQIAGMMPGALGRQMAGATIDDKALAHTEAIILSMTPLERENPQILNASRKKRIAAGCGLEVVDVNRLLKQFDMMQQITKQMTRGRLSKMGGGGMGGRMHGFGRKKRLK